MLEVGLYHEFLGRFGSGLLKRRALNHCVPRQSQPVVSLSDIPWFHPAQSKRCPATPARRQFILYACSIPAHNWQFSALHAMRSAMRLSLPLPRRAGPAPCMLKLACQPLACSAAAAAGRADAEDTLAEDPPSAHGRMVCHAAVQRRDRRAPRSCRSKRVSGAMSCRPSGIISMPCPRRCALLGNHSGVGTTWRPHTNTRGDAA